MAHFELGDDNNNHNNNTSNMSSDSSNVTSPVWSVASTPSITFTCENGITREHDEECVLPKIQLCEPAASTSGSPAPPSDSDFPLRPKVERASSITFSLPPSRQRSNTSNPSPLLQPRRPVPVRAKTAVGTVQNASSSAPPSIFSRSPSLRPGIPRSASAFFLSGNSSSWSVDDMNWFKHSPKLEWARKKFRHGRQPCELRENETPEVRAFWNKPGAPDLHEVVEMIEFCRSKNDPAQDANIDNLEKLYSLIERTQKKSKDILARAMADRESKRIEVCRGACIGLAGDNFTDFHSRIYAFNILAGIASPGQGMNFLKDAEKVIKQNGLHKPGREELLKTVHILMHHVKAKDEEFMTAEKARKDSKDKGQEKRSVRDGDEIEEESKSKGKQPVRGGNEIDVPGPALGLPSIAYPRARVAEPATPSSFLGISTSNKKDDDDNAGEGPSNSGNYTPRTERLVKWVLPSP